MLKIIPQFDTVYPLENQKTNNPRRTESLDSDCGVILMIRIINYLATDKAFKNTQKTGWHENLILKFKNE